MNLTRSLASALCAYLGLTPLLFTPPAHAQAPQYVVQDLGTLGGTYSAAYGVNNLGQVTGGARNSALRDRVFLYSNGTMIDLGGPGDGFGIPAGYSINSLGQIAGSGNSTGHAYLFSGGATTDLGTLGGSSARIATGINYSSQITGYAPLTGNTANHAFLYLGGSMIDLGTLGGTSSYGSGINNAGQVAGYSDTTGNSATHAGLFSAGNSAVDLGTLGGTYSYGNGINNAGQVAGYSYITGDSATHATLFSAGNSPVDLGTLGGTSGYGSGINNAGQVAGYSSTTGNSAQHGFIYSAGTMYDLNNLVSAAQGVSNINMNDVGNHLNDRGQIAASGTVGGQTHAVLLTQRSMGTAFSGGLGDVAGGTFSSGVNAVANGGAVVVGSGRNATNGSAFSWTLNSGMTDFNNATAGIAGATTGVSGDGRYVVGYGSYSGVWTPFRYDRQTSVTTLPGLPAGYTVRSSLASISADGSKAAGYAITAGNVWQPFLWTTTGGWQGLGWLPGSPNNIGTASAISADGATVVGDTTSANSGTSNNEAFRWTQAGGMQALGDLPGGAFNSTARGVSSNGAVIVGDGTTAAGREAFRWTQAGGMVSLGDLAGGATLSIAEGVSGNGQIVVGRATDAVGLKAFVWDNKGGTRSLLTVLSSEYGVDFAGWTLRSAEAISVNGDAVGGAGIDPLGNTQAWSAQINSRTYRFVSGETYAGFHTSKLGGFGTTVDLLDGTTGGTAGSFKTVTVDLLAMPMVLPPQGLASDVIDLTGSGTDTIVLRLGYDEATAIALYGSESKVALGWFNTTTQQWEGANSGNTGGTPNFVGDRAYNAATDFTLGKYGIDTANNQVWAVINHNSQFAVTPEPGSAMLLLLGAGLLATRRRRAELVEKSIEGGL